MKLRWTRLALQDFEHAHDYIAQENPEAARKVAQRVLDAAENLLKFPGIGRVGEDEETREWLVRNTPYLLVYAVRDDAIEILRVWHMSQDRLRQC
ncbi:type II toxin-antitoxin system RelE/ParE family toxin [Desulfurivibrio dismutans]|uniref:type II toxin-antitoxin system RelE/ParE family toxin n=1 Tax=Desulfurivibrio dismutans TaxID=1398908 RepID=UPI0023DB927A|nr:type II toxin-antitoxin system RelE/ParE family toxin [Desulfurivibrio alkaliphilus]MDF1615247.1 type II toxin-antitoxin system RelE/ParE family toxin [Desulfurivibrio alkaliphilus]